jgi:hypothetical protein
MENRQNTSSSILSSIVLSLALIGIGSLSVSAAEPEPSTESARPEHEDVRKLIDERRRAMRDAAEASAESRNWDNLSADQKAEARYVSRVRLELTDLLKEIAPTDVTTPARCHSSAIRFPSEQASAPHVCVEASLHCDEQSLSGFELEVAKRPGVRMENLRVTDQTNLGSRFQFDLCKERPEDDQQ